MPIVFEEEKTLKYPKCDQKFSHTLKFRISESEFMALLNKYTPTVGAILREGKEFGKVW